MKKNIHKKNKNNRFSKRGQKKNVGLILLLLSSFLILFVVLKTSLQPQKTESTNQNTDKQVSITKLPETKIENIDKIEHNERIFGYSKKNRPIIGHVFGTGSEGILLFGSIHGNEMSSADIMNNLVLTLKNNPNLVAQNKKVIIIPILNPDGYYDRTDKLNADEVNLNINFDTSDWQLYGGENNDYAGPNPFSEKESQILRTVVEEFLPEKMLAFHSQGYLVNPENNPSSKQLADWYSNLTGYVYFDDPSWDFTGTATKWFVEKYNKAAITIELSNHYYSDWHLNKNALLKLVSS